jgi:hypothetical protein
MGVKFLEVHLFECAVLQWVQIFYRSMRQNGQAEPLHVSLGVEVER